MSSREKAKMVIHTHTGRGVGRGGGAQRRAPVGDTPSGRARPGDPRGPELPVATPSLPACAITESSFISTAGQDAPRGQGSWAHAPCRNNQTLPAGRPRSRLGSRLARARRVPERLAHPARATPTAGALQPQGKKDARLRFLRKCTHQQLSPEAAGLRPAPAF